MSAPVDVLAVMLADFLDASKERQWYSDAKELAQRSETARAAVAELIEADKELDAAIAAYEHAITITIGGVDYVSPSDPVVERFDAAKARRAAALARVGGAA